MAEAKAAVEAASGLPAARQAVLFAGEELSDERTLASYAVGEYGQDVSLGVQLRPAPLAVFIGSACGHSLRCVRLDPAEEVGLLPGLLVAEGLATEATFFEGCELVVQYSDGRALGLPGGALGMDATLGELQEAIEQAGTPAAEQRLLFRGRHDGHLSAFVAATCDMEEEVAAGSVAPPPPPPLAVKHGEGNYREVCAALCLLDTDEAVAS